MTRRSSSPILAALHEQALHEQGSHEHIGLSHDEAVLIYETMIPIESTSRAIY